MQKAELSHDFSISLTDWEEDVNRAENYNDTPFRQLSKGNNYVAMEMVRLFQGVKFYQ